MVGVYTSNPYTSLAISYANAAETTPKIQIIKGSFGASTQEPLKGIQSYISPYPSPATNTKIVDFPYLDENGELKYKPVSIYVVDVGK